RSSVVIIIPASRMQSSCGHSPVVSKSIQTSIIDSDRRVFLFRSDGYPECSNFLYVSWPTRLISSHPTPRTLGGFYLDRSLPKTTLVESSAPLSLGSRLRP